MKILALECGGDFWGVGLAQIEIGDDAAVCPLAVTIKSEPRALSRELFACIQTTLEAAGLSIEDVNALAVGVGPGSWTGLRIGLTAMKTLAQVRGLPLAGVPSFDPLAQAVWRERDETGSGDTQLLLVTEKCRTNELYGKLYECGDDYLGIVQQEWIGSPQLMADTLGTEALSRGLDAPPILSGSGIESVVELFQSRAEEFLLLQPEREKLLMELALAGAIAIAGDQAADPMSLAPLYLAPSNAERNLIGQ